MNAVQQTVTVGEGGQVALRVSKPVGSRVRVIVLDEAIAQALSEEERFQLPALAAASYQLPASAEGGGETGLVGSFGHIGTLSFYPAHHITMGEGGAVFTRDPLLKRALESFRDWGRDCYCAPGKDNTCGKRFGWQLGALPAGYSLSPCNFSKLPCLAATRFNPECCRMRVVFHGVVRPESK